MSDDERTRASSFRFSGDRERFCQSRVFLRQVIGRYLRLDPVDIVFSKGRYGKPFIEPTKAGSPELCFNLSHCGSVALLAVAIGQPVGIDVEDAADARIADPGALARDFLAPSEARVICEFVDFSDRLRAFLDCWTWKEAVLKAAGLGLEAKLDSFEVPLDGARSGRVGWSADGLTENSAFDVVSLGTGEIFAAVAAPRIAGPIFSFEFANLDSCFPRTLTE